MSTTSTERNDTFAGGEPPQRRAFPWWLLLVALAVLALVVFLVNQGGDTTTDDEQTATDESGDESAASDDEAADDEAVDGTADTEDEADAENEAEAENPDSRPGKITAGGATIYPLQEGLTVGDYDGQEVNGTDVPVESVVADTGFWVGTSGQDRIFVVLTGAGGASAADLSPGDTINFEGLVVSHDADFAEEVGVDSSEGAARLSALAGHVEIEAYELTV